MGRFQQYEVWVLQAGRWQLVAAFFDFDTAAVVAEGRGRNVRVVLATYQDGVPVEQETLGIGTTRKAS